MRAFAVPTVTSGLTAGLSILFFLGLSRAYGDTMLAGIILIQAVVSIVAILCVPGCFVHIIGARTQKEADHRYSASIILEVAGITVGLLVVLIGSVIVGDRAEGATAMFGSVAVQAASATLGRLRTSERWWAYAGWVLMPNIVRLPLILMVLQGWGGDLLPDSGARRAEIIFVFFLLPDLFRLTVSNIPLLLSAFSTVDYEDVKRTIPLVMRNWMYEIGSAITGQADKLIVGFLLRPEILVMYFFSRRLTIIAIMVSEPYFAEFYRRKQMMDSTITYKAIWMRGIFICILLWTVLAISIVTSYNIRELHAFFPTAVATLLATFIALSFVDCVGAANKFSRFLAQVTARAQQLFFVRMLSFALFGTTLFLVAKPLGAWGPVAALGASLLFETVYVRRLVIAADKL